MYANIYEYIYTCIYIHIYIYEQLLFPEGKVPHGDRWSPQTLLGAYVYLDAYAARYIRISRRICCLVHTYIVDAYAARCIRIYV